MIRHLLCATDGSAAAQRGVAFAVEMAVLTRAQVTFLSIYPPEEKNRTRLAYWGVLNMEPDGLPADSSLGRAAAAARMLGAQAHYVKAFGDDAAQAIVDFAMTNNCNHIVLGSTGRSGLNRLLMGSTASDLVRKAHCSATIIR